MCKFREIWSMRNWWNGALFIWQKNPKISPGSTAVATVTAPKIYQEQSLTMYSECSRFHSAPNRSIFGEVIAKRVNTAKNVPWSESDIRLKPSFEPNNYYHTVSSNIVHTRPYRVLQLTNSRFSYTSDKPERELLWPAAAHSVSTLDLSTWLWIRRTTAVKMAGCYVVGRRHWYSWQVADYDWLQYCQQGQDAMQQQTETWTDCRPASTQHEQRLRWCSTVAA